MAFRKYLATVYALTSFGLYLSCEAAAKEKPSPKYEVIVEYESSGRTNITLEEVGGRVLFSTRTGQVVDQKTLNGLEGKVICTHKEVTNVSDPKARH